MELGSFVGEIEGNVVGEVVGSELGSVVGNLEGILDGVCVGLIDGTSAHKNSLRFVRGNGPWANSTSCISTPSIVRSVGSFTPARFRIVGNQSNDEVSSLMTTPAAIFPGQRATRGTRWPPS